MDPIQEYGVSGITSQLAKTDNVQLFTWEPYRQDEIVMLLQEYLETRTDYDHIRNIYSSWTELDSVWQRDYPNIDWKNYSDEQGWPEGYLHEIWNSSNLARDRHLVQSVIELVNEDKTVFVTIGTSHAPRIEKPLRNELTY